MKILLKTRTANEVDWGQWIVTLSRLPSAGEYIAATIPGDSEPGWHIVRVVVHVADAGATHEAEVYCNRVGSTAARHAIFNGTQNAGAVTGAGDIPPVLLTLTQAAKSAGVSVRTLRRLIHAGRLQAVNYSTGHKRHEWRIEPDALKAFIPAQQNTSVPQASLPDRFKVRSDSASARSVLPRFIPPKDK